MALVNTPTHTAKLDNSQSTVLKPSHQIDIIFNKMIVGDGSNNIPSSHPKGDNSSPNSTPPSNPTPNNNSPPPPNPNPLSSTLPAATIPNHTTHILSPPLAGVPQHTPMLDPPEGTTASNPTTHHITPVSSSASARLEINSSLFSLPAEVRGNCDRGADGDHKDSIIGGGIGVSPQPFNYPTPAQSHQDVNSAIESIQSSHLATMTGQLFHSPSQCNRFLRQPQQRQSIPHPHHSPNLPNYDSPSRQGNVRTNQGDWNSYQDNNNNNNLNNDTNSPPAPHQHLLFTAPVAQSRTNPLSAASSSPNSITVSRNGNGTVSAEHDAMKFTPTIAPLRRSSPFQPLNHLSPLQRQQHLQHESGNVDPESEALNQFDIVHHMLSPSPQTKSLPPQQQEHLQFEPFSRPPPRANQYQHQQTHTHQHQQQPQSTQHHSLQPFQLQTQLKTTPPLMSTSTVANIHRECNPESLHLGQCGAVTKLTELSHLDFNNCTAITSLSKQVPVQQTTTATTTKPSITSSFILPSMGTTKQQNITTSTPSKKTVFVLPQLEQCLQTHTNALVGNSSTHQPHPNTNLIEPFPITSLKSASIQPLPRLPAASTLKTSNGNGSNGSAQEGASTGPNTLVLQSRLKADATSGPLFDNLHNTKPAPNPNLFPPSSERTLTSMNFNPQPQVDSNLNPNLPGATISTPTPLPLTPLQIQPTTVLPLPQVPPGTRFQLPSLASSAVNASNHAHSNGQHRTSTIILPSFGSTSQHLDLSDPTPTVQRPLTCKIQQSTMTIPSLKTQQSSIQLPSLSMTQCQTVKSSAPNTGIQLPRLMTASTTQQPLSSNNSPCLPSHHLSTKQSVSAQFYPLKSGLMEFESTANNNNNNNINTALNNNLLVPSGPDSLRISGGKLPGNHHLRRAEDSYRDNSPRDDSNNNPRSTSISPPPFRKPSLLGTTNLPSRSRSSSAHSSSSSSSSSPPPPFFQHVLQVFGTIDDSNDDREGGKRGESHGRDSKQFTEIPNYSTAPAPIASNPSHLLPRPTINPIPMTSTNRESHNRSSNNNAVANFFSQLDQSSISSTRSRRDAVDDLDEVFTNDRPKATGFGVKEDVDGQGGKSIQGQFRTPHHQLQTQPSGLKQTPSYRPSDAKLSIPAGAGNVNGQNGDSTDYDKNLSLGPTIPAIVHHIDIIPTPFKSTQEAGEAIIGLFGKNRPQDGDFGGSNSNDKNGSNRQNDCSLKSLFSNPNLVNYVKIGADFHVSVNPHYFPNNNSLSTITNFSIYCYHDPTGVICPSDQIALYIRQYDGCSVVFSQVFLTIRSLFNPTTPYSTFLNSTSPEKDPNQSSNVSTPRNGDRILNSTNYGSIFFTPSVASTALTATPSVCSIKNCPDENVGEGSMKSVCRVARTCAHAKGSEHNHSNNSLSPTAHEQSNLHSPNSRDVITLDTPRSVVAPELPNFAATQRRDERKGDRIGAQNPPLVAQPHFDLNHTINSIRSDHNPTRSVPLTPHKLPLLNPQIASTLLNQEDNISDTSPSQRPLFLGHNNSSITCPPFAIPLGPNPSYHTHGDSFHLHYDALNQFESSLSRDFSERTDGRDSFQSLQLLPRGFSSDNYRNRDGRDSFQSAVGYIHRDSVLGFHSGHFGTETRERGHFNPNDAEFQPSPFAPRTNLKNLSRQSFQASHLRALGQEVVWPLTGAPQANVAHGHDTATSQSHNTIGQADNLPLNLTTVNSHHSQHTTNSSRTAFGQLSATNTSESESTYRGMLVGGGEEENEKTTTTPTTTGTAAIAPIAPIALISSHPTTKNKVLTQSSVPVPVKEHPTPRIFTTPLLSDDFSMGQSVSNGMSTPSGPYSPFVSHSNSLSGFILNHRADGAMTPDSHNLGKHVPLWIGSTSPELSSCSGFKPDRSALYALHSPHFPPNVVKRQSIHVTSTPHLSSAQISQHLKRQSIHITTSPRLRSDALISSTSPHLNTLRSGSSLTGMSGSEGISPYLMPAVASNLSLRSFSIPKNPHGSSPNNATHQLSSTTEQPPPPPPPPLTGASSPSNRPNTNMNAVNPKASALNAQINAVDIRNDGNGEELEEEEEEEEGAGQQNPLLSKFNTSETIILSAANDYSYEYNPFGDSINLGNDEDIDQLVDFHQHLKELVDIGRSLPGLMIPDSGLCETNSITSHLNSDQNINSPQNSSFANTPTQQHDNIGVKMNQSLSSYENIPDERPRDGLIHDNIQDGNRIISLHNSSLPQPPSCQPHQSIPSPALQPIESPLTTNNVLKNTTNTTSSTPVIEREYINLNPRKANLEHQYQHTMISMPTLSYHHSVAPTYSISNYSYRAYSTVGWLVDTIISVATALINNVEPNAPHLKIDSLSPSSSTASTPHQFLPPPTPTSLSTRYNQSERCRALIQSFETLFSHISPPSINYSVKFALPTSPNDHCELSSTAASSPNRSLSLTSSDNQSIPGSAELLSTHPSQMKPKRDSHNPRIHHQQPLLTNYEIKKLIKLLAFLATPSPKDNFVAFYHTINRNDNTKPSLSPTTLRLLLSTSSLSMAPTTNQSNSDPNSGNCNTKDDHLFDPQSPAFTPFFVDFLIHTPIIGLTAAVVGVITRLLYYHSTYAHKASKPGSDNDYDSITTTTTTTTTATEATAQSHAIHTSYTHLSAPPLPSDSVTPFPPSSEQTTPIPVPRRLESIPNDSNQIVESINADPMHSLMSTMMIDDLQKHGGNCPPNADLHHHHRNNTNNTFNRSNTPNSANLHHRIVPQLLLLKEDLDVDLNRLKGQLVSASQDRAILSHFQPFEFLSYLQLETFLKMIEQ